MYKKNTYKNVEFRCLDIGYHYEFHKNQCEMLKKGVRGVNPVPPAVEKYVESCGRIEDLIIRANNKGSVRKYFDAQAAMEMSMVDLIRGIEVEKGRSSAETQKAADSLLRQIESYNNYRKEWEGIGDLIQSLGVDTYDEYVRRVGVAGRVRIVEECDKAVKKDYKGLDEVGKEIVKEVETKLEELDTLYVAVESDMQARLEQNKQKELVDLRLGLIAGDSAAKKHCRLVGHDKFVGFYRMKKDKYAADTAIWNERSRKRLQNGLCHRRRGHRHG